MLCILFKLQNNKVQKYIDIGMYTTDPEDRPNGEMLEAYLGQRKSVFVTMARTAVRTSICTIQAAT